MVTKASQQSWNFSLPGYKYCGPGTPILVRLQNWKQNAPINKLDLACFYHDLSYSNYSSTPISLRWADYVLLHAAKAISKGDYGENKLSFFKKLKLSMEARLVVDAIELKIDLENEGLMNAVDYKTKNATESWEIFNLVFSTPLPQALNLPFYYFKIIQ